MTVAVLGQFANVYLSRLSSDDLEARVVRFIERSEEEVENIIEKAMPKAGFVVGADDSTPEIIHGALTMSRHGGDDTPIGYSLRVSFRFNIGVTEGPPGRVIGYKVRFSEQFSNLMATNQDGDLVFSRANVYKNGFADYDPDGVLISHLGNLSMTHFMRSNGTSCHWLENLKNRLTDMKEEKIYIQPIFQNIENTPQEFSFEIRFFDDAIWSCSDLMRVDVMPENGDL